ATGTINISSPSLTGLAFSGAGALTAGGGISVTATIFDLALNTTRSFGGPTTFNATGGQILVGSGVALSGADASSSLTMNALALSMPSGSSLNFAGVSGSLPLITNNGQITSTGTLAITGPSISVFGSGTMSATGGISLSTTAASNANITFNNGHTFQGS